MSCGGNCGGTCEECKSKKMPIGPIGPTGATGATGPKGPDGDKGATGDPGEDAPVLKGFCAYAAPEGFGPNADFSPAAGVPITFFTELYDDDPSFNPITGVWTCPSAGRYDLNATCNLYGSLLSAGFVALAICPALSASDIFTADHQITDVTTEETHISTTSQGVLLTAGYQINLRFLNHTAIAYIASANDKFTFSIRKVKP